MAIKNTIILSVISLLTVLFAPGAYAGRISAEESLSRLQRQESQIRRLPAAMSLVDTEMRNGEPIYYVFSGGEGYTVTTADDMLTPVLAIVETGVYDKALMNPAAADWLQMLSDEIEYCYAHPEMMKLPDGDAFEDFTRLPIEPLITARWDQSAPYNDRCPVYSGGRAVTGCVATAMAMVMHHHRYPETGNGFYRYVFNGVTISFDYDNTPFDWDNMLDVYSSEATEEECNAVADLMLACGVSVDMQYTTQASGAYSQLIPSALINRFGYSRDAKFVMREFYNVGAWDRLVYKTLQEEGPVLYCGRGMMGGHQFVCDGYLTAGLFHFNWGWSGESDGYFKLTALNPESLGIGGGGGGFNAGQGIVTGLHIPIEGEEASMPNIVSSGTFRVMTNNNSEWRFTSGEGVYNLDDRRVTVNLGLRLLDEEGTPTYVASDTETEFKPLSKSLNYSVVSKIQLDLSLLNLAPGIYKATPAFRWNDRWADIPQQVDYASYVEIKVNEDGTMTYSNKSADTVYDLEVSNFKLNGEPTDGVYDFDITVANYSLSKYSGCIIGHVLDFDMNEELAQFDVELSVKPQNTISFNFSSDLNLEKSFYHIYFTDEYGKIIGPLFDVLAGAPIENISYAGESVTVGVGEQLQLAIDYMPAEAAFPRFSYMLDDYQIASIDESGVISGLSVGETSLKVSTLDGSMLDLNVDLVVTMPVGIGMAEVAPESFDIYSVSGVLIASDADRNSLPDLAPGVYILKSPGKVEKWIRR